MRRAFLVFDAGTGAGRSLVVNDQGEILGTAYKEWGYQEIPDAPEGLELDARHFLRILLQAGAQAIKASGIAPASIKAIAVTGQREGVVFLNGRGQLRWPRPTGRQGTGGKARSRDLLHRRHLPTYLRPSCQAGMVPKTFARGLRPDQRHPDPGRLAGLCPDGREGQ